MGLTGGLADVGTLYDCLYGIHKGIADESILDRYSEVRIEKWKNIIDPISSDNMRRMWQDPQKVKHQDPFLQLCRNLADDKTARQQMLLVSNASL